MVLPGPGARDLSTGWARLIPVLLHSRMSRTGTLALLLLCASPLLLSPASAFSLPPRATRPPLAMALSSAPPATNGKVRLLHREFIDHKTSMITD